MLSSSTDSAIVAFEAEEPSMAGVPRWSVAVTGLAIHVPDALLPPVLCDGEFGAWPDHARCHGVAISTDRVSGRQLSREDHLDLFRPDAGTFVPGLPRRADR